MAVIGRADTASPEGLVAALKDYEAVAPLAHVCVRSQIEHLVAEWALHVTWDVIQRLAAVALPSSLVGC